MVLGLRNWREAQKELHNDTCDTAFESLDVIVFDMIIFGYYSGTQNTNQPYRILSIFQNLQRMVTSSISRLREYLKTPYEDPCTVNYQPLGKNTF